MFQCFRIEEAPVILLSKEYTGVGVDDPEQANGENLNGKDDGRDDSVEESCLSKCLLH